jgi:hypothetical protein
MLSWWLTPFTVNAASRSTAAGAGAGGRAISPSILLSRRRNCGCLSQSLRRAVLYLCTREAQTADLGYVVECTGRETRGRGWVTTMLRRVPINPIIGSCKVGPAVLNARPVGEPG